MQQGIIRFVWYLLWAFFLTIIIRGLISLGVKILIRRWPDTLETLHEFERYGWWISLVLGALLASLL